jgi:gamma-glutamyltranspeptidase/glutathione hydrolase
MDGLVGPAAATECARGARYAVSAGCREAAEAAAALLDAGGNVVDAALCASAVLCVALPQAVTIGGDLFALVQMGSDTEVVAVNASGPASQQATIEEYRRRGLTYVPAIGPLSIEVPGLVAGWDALHARWGSRPLGQILEPAVELARAGFSVGERLSRCITLKVKTFAGLPGWAETFLPEGRPLAAGERLVQPGLARTLTRSRASRSAAPKVSMRGPSRRTSSGRPRPRAAS